MKRAYYLSVYAAIGLIWIAACTATSGSSFDDDNNGLSGQGGNQPSAGSGAFGFGGNFSGVGGGCGKECSADLHAVVDCQGNLIEECTGLLGCDIATATCTNACEAAESNKQSVGCSYYATDMDSYSPTYCFAAFVANTWNIPAHLTVEYQGNTLALDNFARIPTGQGPSLSYAPYDSVNGLAPGEVAILFLSGSTGTSPMCPAPTAATTAGTSGTGVSDSFLITSDVPVVAYQINPYGGGSSAVTGASLLLPTSAWDTNYIAVNAYQQDLTGPSLNIIAQTDNTTVTMVPVAAVDGGNGLPSSPANTPFSFVIHKGQNAQFSQNAELSGSVIQADKPIGFMAGHPCMRTPVGVAYCDHGEQMIPPVQAMGSEYVGVMHRPRSGEPAIWRIIGAVDGTQLTWSSNVGGPATLAQGQIAEFVTGTPFVVSSQDKDHPFMLFSYMSGSQWSMLQDTGGHGDVDFVLSVPPDQYMSHYVFFADPTYPETNLVVVRSPDKQGNFSDVTLDCAGPLSGWQAVGNYEWTRTDLITGNFQGVGNCSTGRREMSSDGRFGLWVWGWGTPDTSDFTANVSYGYPAGMNVQPINQVVIPPIPN